MAQRLTLLGAQKMQGNTWRSVSRTWSVKQSFAEQRHTISLLEREGMLDIACSLCGLLWW